MNVCLNVHKHINTHTLCKFKQVHRQFPIYKLYMSQMLDHELCEMQNTVLTETLSLKEDKATHGPTTCLLNTQNTRTQVAAIYTMSHLKIYSVSFPPEPGTGTSHHLISSAWEDVRREPFHMCRCSSITDHKYMLTKTISICHKMHMPHRHL